MPSTVWPILVHTLRAHSVVFHCVWVCRFGARLGPAICSVRCCVLKSDVHICYCPPLHELGEGGRASRATVRVAHSQIFNNEGFVRGWVGNQSPNNNHAPLLLQHFLSIYCSNADLVVLAFIIENPSLDIGDFVADLMLDPSVENQGIVCHFGFEESAF